MGYRSSPRDTHVRMKSENKQAALNAIITAMPNGQRQGTLERELEDWGWAVELDDDGNIVEVWFEGDSLGEDDKLLFQAIAPYVEAGSSIEIEDLEASLYRWYFDGQTMKEQWGRVVYEED